MLTVNKSITDYVQTLFSRFGIKLVNFIFFLVLARYLTINEMAVYGFFFSMSLLLSVVFDAGNRNVIAKMVGANSAYVGSAIKYLFSIYSVMACIVLALFVLGIGVSHFELIGTVQIEFLLLLGSMTFIRMFQGLLLGRGLITKFNKSEMVSRLALLAMLLFMLTTEQVTLNLACLSLALSQFISALYLLWIITNLDKSKNEKLSVKDIQSLMKNGGLFMIAVFLMNISKQLHFYVLTEFDDNFSGAYFSIYRICEIVTEVSIAVSIVLFSRATNDKSDKDTLIRLSKASRITLTLLAPLFIFVILFSELFIGLLLGDSYLAYVSEFRLILAASYLGVFWNMLFPSLSVILPVWYLIILFLVVNAFSGVMYLFIGVNIEYSSAVYMLSALLTSLLFLLVINSRFRNEKFNFFFVKKEDFLPVLARLRK